MSYKQKYYKISKYIYLYIYCFTYLLYTCIYCIYLHLYWISMQIPLWTNTAFLSVHIFISFYSRNLLRLSVCVCICLFVFACVCPNTHTHTHTHQPRPLRSHFTRLSVSVFGSWDESLYFIIAAVRFTPPFTAPFLFSVHVTVPSKGYHIQLRGMLALRNFGTLEVNDKLESKMMCFKLYRQRDIENNTTEIL